MRELFVSVLLLLLGGCAGAETAVVGPETIHAVVRARAVVEPRGGSARVASTASGRVVEVLVEEGSTVAVGDTLATIDSEMMIGPTAIVSPIAGVVLARHADVGDDVSRADGALFEIADTSRVRLRFELDADDAARVTEGASVRATAPGGDDVLAESTVLRLSAQMTTRRIGAGGLESAELVRTGLVEVSPSGALAIGRELEVSIALASHDAALAAPHAALSVEEGRPVVHVPGALGDQVVAVELGASDGDFVEILSGLTPGARVVVAR
jgi:cobalt-zinc-cadmium efflux system membrane fusion protein